MSFDPTRKSFFKKLFGVAAVAGLAPRLFAKRLQPEPSSEASPVVLLPVKVRPDTRAVAHHED